MMTEPDLETPGPYETAAFDYRNNGFEPLPVVGKAGNLPRGFTGQNGAHVTDEDVVFWFAQGRGHDNICLRLNGVIGIDVDAYRKGEDLKTGDITLEMAEARWGKLPPTWRSSARGEDNPSGIRFYRVPEGYIHLATILKMADEETGEVFSDVEIIQYHHRYAVVWPSVNPDTDTQYRWYSPSGPSLIKTMPTLKELPELPAAWLEGLQAEALQAADRDYVAPAPQHAPIPDWHPVVDQTYEEAFLACKGDSGSRHDNVLIKIGLLCRLESNGESGATTALEVLREAFVHYVGADRGEAAAEAEYDRMVESSRSMVATRSSTHAAKDPQAEMAEMFGIGPDPEPRSSEPVEIDTEADDPFEGFGAWKPVDLGKYLDGDWKPEPPTLLRRSDGKCLYYSKNVNWLHGASGEGKTWVALVCAAQEIQAGHHVLWVHYEDPEADKITHRLTLLGLEPEQISEYFHVCLVGAESMVDGIPFLRAIVGHYRPSLVIIDSIGEAIGADGIAVKEDERFVKWIHDTTRVLAADGPGVIGIDHVPMGDSQRLDPVGSFRKKAATTGSMFLAQSPKAPTQNSPGYITLTCAKDRSGVWTKGEVIALVKMSPGEGGKVCAVVEPPKFEDAGQASEAEEVTAARHAVRAIKERGRLSRSDLVSSMVGIKLRTTAKREGIDWAVYRGWLQVEPGGSKNARFYILGDVDPESPTDLLERWE